MKIIITDSFRETFEKQFKRYPIQMEDFIVVLQNTSFISLEIPLQKLKAVIHGVALRGIVMLENDTLVPLFVVLKSNKLWGRNLVLDKKTREKVNRLMLEMEHDLKNKRYLVYH